MYLVMVEPMDLQPLPLPEEHLHIPIHGRHQEERLLLLQD